MCTFFGMTQKPNDKKNGRINVFGRDKTCACIMCTLRKRCAMSHTVAYNFNACTYTSTCMYLVFLALTVPNSKSISTVVSINNSLRYEQTGNKSHLRA